MNGVSLSYIVIDKNRCKSCYLCVDACPKKLIRKSDYIGTTGNYVVEFKDDKNECIGCQSCALTCPDLAVTEVYK